MGQPRRLDHCRSCCTCTAAATFTGCPSNSVQSSRTSSRQRHASSSRRITERPLNLPYPAAFNDCYDTLLWVRDHAASIGGRTDGFIVSGHSAGGGLAAAVSLKATETGDAKIAFQMPLYPMIDDRQNSASAVGNDAPVWDEEANRLAWSRYLDGVKNVTPYAAAARCTDYTKLPPTITYVGSLEPFRDETKIYVENLRRANVPVEFEVFDGAFHGFDVMVPEAPISKRANQFLMGNFQKFVQRYFP